MHDAHAEPVAPHSGMNASCSPTISTLAAKLFATSTRDRPAMSSAICVGPVAAFTSLGSVRIQTRCA
mgnify:CR=1 FL=1